MQCRLRGDICVTGDRRRNFAFVAIEPAIVADEGAADNALLDPRFAFGELAIRCEAGKLGAGTGPARRAVVGLTGTQNKVATVRFERRPEEFNVIDFREALLVRS